MDEITKANVLKMQGRFSAIEVALRALIQHSADPDAMRGLVRASIEPTLNVLAGTGNRDHLLVRDSMAETMDALLDMA